MICTFLQICIGLHLQFFALLWKFLNESHRQNQPLHFCFSFIVKATEPKKNIKCLYYSRNIETGFSRSIQLIIWHGFPSETFETLWYKLCIPFQTKTYPMPCLLCLYFLFCFNTNINNNNNKQYEWSKQIFFGLQQNDD